MSYNECKPLVTVEEAIRLSPFRTITDMSIADDILKECVKTFSSDDETIKYFKIISTIWNAGRIQGIREERKKGNRYI